MRWAVLLCALCLALGARGSGAEVFHDRAEFEAALGTWTEIDFDVDPANSPLASGTDLATMYLSLGVGFGPEDSVQGFNGNEFSAPNGWNADGIAPVFGAQITRANVTAVGVRNIGFGAANGATLLAYDAQDQVLGAVTSDSDGSTKDFFGLTTGAPIARIEIVLGPNPGGWGYDDLVLGIPVLPAWALAALAGALLALAARGRAD